MIRGNPLPFRRKTQLYREEVLTIETESSTTKESVRAILEKRRCLCLCAIRVGFILRMWSCSERVEAGSEKGAPDDDDRQTDHSRRNHPQWRGFACASFACRARSASTRGKEDGRSAHPARSGQKLRPVSCCRVRTRPSCLGDPRHSILHPLS